VRDPITGEKKKKESANWWGRYRGADGAERRVSLSPSKDIAQRKLREILDEVDQEKAGVITSVEMGKKTPIAKHVADFILHRRAKENSASHIHATEQRIQSFIDTCKWKNISQINESDVETFLLWLRKEQGRSIQTSNAYLKAIKCFTRWLARTKRITADPLAFMSALNAKTDPRHARRPLESDEFARLVHVAETGPPRVGLLGRDRAMLYILAAWTGFRRGELGSLTLRSFNLESNPATITVEASYSKHRRRDVQILHPDIVGRFKEWLTKRNPKDADEILFPVSARTCGTTRCTADMIQFDLAAAHRFWVAETDAPTEQKARRNSEFLAYKNKAGQFADFHGLRHTFITNLRDAGVDPKVAQKLARHSDIRLTMDIYTHVKDKAEVDAINSLPGLPSMKK
jgi:site-specific recombinase XerD